MAREFYLKTTEAWRKLALWQPLGAYLEGVAEVLETSGHLKSSTNIKGKDKTHEEMFVKVCVPPPGM